jgi:hypothetical protein
MNENNTGGNVTQYQDHCKKCFTVFIQIQNCRRQAQNANLKQSKFPAANVHVSS